MKHLLISYHTCPTEQPGQDLSGGMNVLLLGFLRYTRFPTDVVTRGFGVYQVEELTPLVRVHHLPCGANRPWTREAAWNCLGAFKSELKNWLIGRSFDFASAHYWMSATLLDELGLPGGIMFHTLQAQKGTARTELELIRQDREARLIEKYPSAYLHWHDLNNARRHHPALRGTVVRPGVSVAPAREAVAGPPYVYGWAARNDPIKNLDQALHWLAGLQEPSQLLVAGMQDGPERENVRYLGALQHAEMGQFYGQIHQLLNLSDYETYGLSLLEALACGAAVGVREDSDWARRLRRLGLPFQPGARFSEEHKRRARILAEAHSWPRAVNSWERWLSRLLKG
ncbi:hypothetical protein JST97_01910 [bacterium]|nr:hypothetical protein [bacterium]